MAVFLDLHSAVPPPKNMFKVTAYNRWKYDANIKDSFVGGSKRMLPYL